MRIRHWFLIPVLCFYSTFVNAQGIDALAPAVRKFLRVNTAKIILAHVEIIDGTGAAPIADQNISIVGGKIAAITAGADRSPSNDTTILDLRGYSVMPGIVGMHNHLYYSAQPNLAADYTSEGPGISFEMT